MAASVFSPVAQDFVAIKVSKVELKDPVTFAALYRKKKTEQSNTKLDPIKANSKAKKNSPRGLVRFCKLWSPLDK